MGLTLSIATLLATGLHVFHYTYCQRGPDATLLGTSCLALYTFIPGAICAIACVRWNPGFASNVEKWLPTILMGGMTSIYVAECVPIVHDIATMEGPINVVIVWVIMLLFHIAAWLGLILVLILRFVLRESRNRWQSPGLPAEPR